MARLFMVGFFGIFLAAGLGFLVPVFILPVVQIIGAMT